MSDVDGNDDYDFYFDQAAEIKDLEREKEYRSRLEAKGHDEYERQQKALANIDKKIEKLKLTTPNTCSFATGNVSNVKQIPKLEAQETAILELISSHNYDPQNLPFTEPGKTGIKDSIRTQALSNHQLFVSKAVFNKAWQRLRKNKDIDCPEQ